MITFFSILLALIFACLAIIHFNWALGGKWGINQTLPTNEEGKKVLNPKTIDSVIVGIVLSVFFIYYLIIAQAIHLSLPFWMLQYGSWIIPSIFTLRAIGDFKYLGFFRRIKSTEFAHWDKVLFSPLCASISIKGFIIASLQ